LALGFPPLVLLTAAVVVVVAVVSPNVASQFDPEPVKVHALMDDIYPVLYPCETSISARSFPQAPVVP
jgi:hypothetical protein